MALPCVEVDRPAITHVIQTTRPPAQSTVGRFNCFTTWEPERVKPAQEVIQQYCKDYIPKKHHVTFRALGKLWISALRSKKSTAATRIPKSKAAKIASLCLTIWRANTCLWTQTWVALLDMTTACNLWTGCLFPHRHLVHCLKALGPLEFYSKDCLALLTQSMKVLRSVTDCFTSWQMELGRKTVLSIWKLCLAWEWNSAWDELTYRQFFDAAKHIAVVFRPFLKQFLSYSYGCGEEIKFLRTLALKAFRADEKCGSHFYLLRTRIARLPRIGCALSVGYCLQDCLAEVESSRSQPSGPPQPIRLNPSYSDSHYMPQLLDLWSELGKGHANWQLAACKSMRYGRVNTPYSIDVQGLTTMMRAKFWENNMDTAITKESFEKWTKVCEHLDFEKSGLYGDTMAFPEEISSSTEDRHDRQTNENESEQPAKRQRVSQPIRISENDRDDVPCIDLTNIKTE